METQEDIVIVGAGVAGLTVALGLHRLGFRSLVLESSDGLRSSGFALTLWTNAWRALDSIGIGDSLRCHSLRIRAFHVLPVDSGLPTSDSKLTTDGSYGDNEIRCVRRKELLETLENELPRGTIKYSSKVVLIEDAGCFKLVHLADGSTLKTRVLIGSDGVNSVVAKLLGLQKPVTAGRSAIRGFVEFPEGHGFDPKLHIHFGGGFRYGFIPCDEKSLYWFCTFTPSLFKYDEDMDENPAKMKQFVLSKLGNGVAKEISNIVERTELECVSSAPLKFRSPWNLLFGNIVESNVCVVGDALHPMTPDIGQGGCSALEDGVVLARCLGEALSIKSSKEISVEGQKEYEYERIRKGLEKYAKQRRWRSFSLISTAYVVGLIQETDGKVINFLREKGLSKFTVWMGSKMANFDCGKLHVS